MQQKLKIRTILRQKLYPKKTINESCKIFFTRYSLQNIYTRNRTRILSTHVMSAPGSLELVIDSAVRIYIILVVDLLHKIPLIVIAQVVDMMFSRHLWRRNRAVNTRHRFQHPLQGIRVQTNSAILRVLNPHVVGALAPRSVTVVVVDNVEDIAILHLQLSVVGRLRVMQLLLAQRFALQGTTSLRTLRLEHLDAVLLCGTVLALLLRLLRRYRGALLIRAVNLFK